MVPSQVRPVRVLAVDDDVDILTVVREVLSEAGHIAICAVGGQAALQILERATEAVADVVLLDLMMPFVDGLTLLRELRARPAWTDIPVIVMTASHSTGEKLVAHDVQGFIAKPFDIDHIIRTVERACSGQIATQPALR